MKRILNYIFIMLLAVSCNKNMLEENTDATGKVTVSFSVSVPAPLETKAFNEAPEIESLHLAVFDEAGYFCEYVEADPTGTEYATENVKKYPYTAKISASADPRTIHFIANGPANMNFGDEVSLIAGLAKESHQDAYWARVELPRIKKGALIQEIEGDSDEYEYNPETPDKLDDIALVRNFTRVTVKSDAENFQLLGYVLVNEPNKGSVAPYNTETGRFQTNYLNSRSDYHAFMPLSAQRDNSVEENIPDNCVGITTPYYTYLYESSQNGSANDVYMIVKGKYGSDANPTYYKILLRDENKLPFDLLRNCSYVFNIHQVNRSGSATPAIAAAGDGLGDLSGYGKEEGITNISDGTNRLFVTYSEITIVDGFDQAKQNYVEFGYKFVTGINTSSPTVSNDKVSFTNLESGNVIDDYEIVDGEDGYKVIKIQQKAPGQSQKEQTITLTATSGEEGAPVITRDVKFILVRKNTMILHCVPNSVEKGIGKEFSVVIEIPANDLQKSIFPLDFQIESDNESIAPAASNKLPVYTGSSIVPNKTRSFGFTKTITWDDYQDMDESQYQSGYKQFTCYFSTTKENSDCNIYAYNKYFNDPVSDHLGNHVMKTFTVANTPFTNMNGQTVTEVEAGSDVYFTFALSDVAPANEKISLTLNGFEKADDETRLIYNRSTGRYELTPGVEKTFTVKLNAKTNVTTASIGLECFQFTPKPNAASIPVANQKCHITITPDLMEFAPNTGSANLTATVDPADATVTYTAADTQIAKVSANGTVTPGSKAGQTTITATASASGYDNGTATAIVRVVYVNLSTSKTMVRNKVENNIATFLGMSTNSTTSEVVYTSSNPSVVKIENGKLTSVAAGTATITATLAKFPSVKATCTITVTNNRWRLVENVSEIEAGKSYAFVGNVNGTMKMLPNTNTSTYNWRGTETVNSSNISGANFDVVNTEKTNTFSLTKSGTKYSIASEATDTHGTLYLRARRQDNSTAWICVDTGGANDTWNVTIDATTHKATMLMTAANKPNNRYLDYTNSTFRYDGSNSNNLYIYEYIAD